MKIFDALGISHDRRLQAAARSRYAELGRAGAGLCTRSIEGENGVRKLVLHSYRSSKPAGTADASSWRTGRHLCRS
jgi:hypothetical protein